MNGWRNGDTGQAFKAIVAHDKALERVFDHLEGTEDMEEAGKAIERIASMFGLLVGFDPDRVWWNHIAKSLSKSV